MRIHSGDAGHWPRILFYFLLSLMPCRAESDLDFARRLNNAFVAVAENVSPSVVVVRVQPRQDRTGTERDEILKYLPEEFREELDPARREEEQGCGVVLRPEGYIITNGHVVEDAGTIEVRLQDGRRFPAKVKGVDTESDLAVLKVDATGLPAAKLGDSSRVRVGEFAIAIGAPFELDYSVTVGHVSAKGRRVLTDDLMMDQDFLQTDASINPGNSGGPLVNLESEIVGINTMIHGLNTGIGFAVPINLVREVADQLIETGKFTRAWLGVSIATLGRDRVSKPDGVPVDSGVVVLQILRDGPMSGSELRPRDVIVAVDGNPIDSDAELRRQISRRPIDRPVPVEVYRGEKRLVLQLTPGELPAERWALGRRTRVPMEVTAEKALGLTIQDLDRETARRAGVESGGGVLVTRVEPGSPAEQHKIRPGDVVTKIDRHPVRNRAEFAEAIDDADVDKGVHVTVVSAEGGRLEVLQKTNAPAVSR